MLTVTSDKPYVLSKTHDESLLEIEELKHGVEMLYGQLDTFNNSVPLLNNVNTYVHKTVEDDEPIVIDLVNTCFKNVGIMTGIEYKQYYVDITYGTESIFSSISKAVEAVFDKILDIIEAIIDAIGRFIKAIIDFITSLFGGKKDDEKDDNSVSKTVEEEITNLKEAIKEDSKNVNNAGSNFKANAGAVKEDLIAKVKDLIKDIPALLVIEDCVTEKDGFTVKSLGILLENINKTAKQLDKDKITGYGNLNLMEYLISNKNIEYNNGKLAGIDIFTYIENFYKQFNKTAKFNDKALNDILLKFDENGGDINTGVFGFKILVDSVKDLILTQPHNNRTDFKSNLDFFNQSEPSIKIKTKVRDKITSHIVEKDQNIKSDDVLMNILGISLNTLYIAYIPKTHTTIEDIKNNIVSIESKEKEYMTLRDNYNAKLNSKGLNKARNLPDQKEKIDTAYQNSLKKLIQEIISLFINTMDIICKKLTYKTMTIDMKSVFSEFINDEIKLLDKNYLEDIAGKPLKDVFTATIDNYESELTLFTNLSQNLETSGKTLKKYKDTNESTLNQMVLNINKIKDDIKENEIHKNSLTSISSLVQSYSKIVTKNYTEITKILTSCLGTESNKKLQILYDNINDILKKSVV